MDEFAFSTGAPKVQNIHIPGGKPVSYQQLTVSTLAVGLTVPSSANHALITLETDSCRWRDDGTSPTSTIGMPLVAGQSMELLEPEVLANFKIIRDSNSVSDAILNIAYYRKQS